MDNDEKIIFSLAETHKSTSSSSTESHLSDLSSSEDASSLSSDNEEDVDVLLFPLMQYLNSGSRTIRVENYLELIHSWTDEEFREHLRVNRHTALKLIHDLELSGFIPAHSFGMRPITAELSLLLFLWYIANTEPLRTMSDRFNISISSVFRVLRRVANWFLTQKDTAIAWPQGRHQVAAVTEKFASIHGIQKVLGAIDGTHLRIQKPSVHKKDYYNRKRFYSITLQAVVDANMKFTNIHCGEPGSVHDARILRRSPLHDAVVENEEILFPDNTFLLGDSAYTSKSWLVRPFRDNGHLTRNQHEFNRIHSSTRTVVERAFGTMKGRFRRIKFFTEYRELSFVIKTVVAACILHNYCIDQSDYWDGDEYYSDDDDDDDDIPMIDNERFGRRVRGDARRNEIFQELFP